MEVSGLLIQLINWLPSYMGGNKSLETRPREKQQSSNLYPMAVLGLWRIPANSASTKIQYLRACGLVSNPNLLLLKCKRHAAPGAADGGTTLGRETRLRKGCEVQFFFSQEKAQMTKKFQNPLGVLP